MLPQEHTKWLAQQPAETLSLRKVRNARNGLGYIRITVDRKSIATFTEKIVGRCLTRNSDRIQADMYAEIRDSVEDLCGMDKDSWREIHGHRVITKIADRTGTCAMFGLNLCRDHIYMHNLGHLNKLRGVASIVIGQLPPLTGNVIGYLYEVPVRYCKTEVLRILVPLITEQMQGFERYKRDAIVPNPSKRFPLEQLQSL